MSARDHALAQIDRASLPGWRRSIIRHKPPPPTDARDIALAEQIAVGVIKNHGLLEHLLSHHARHQARIDPLVRKIIAIGLYQIRFLTRVPASAAVHEAVEQSRRFGKRHAAGFVNAVLRRAAREPEVPLPNRADDPERYAAIVLSHPPELSKRLVELLGVEHAIQFCEHDNREPPTLVRAFRDLAFPPPSELPSVRITPHEQLGIHVIEGAKRDTLAALATRGLAQVQDATAAHVVERLDLCPGQEVLDRCAGLGTKTMQIHDHVREQGWIMAVDPSEARCRGLRELLQKRKIENVAVVQASLLRQIAELKRSAFDRILVDVPCSNSGVLARRPEARYAQTPQAIESLVALQDEIMDDTAPYLRAGGLLVYSTCSVWPEENDRRVERFLAVHREFELLDSQFTWPSFDDPNPSRYHDGGYSAVLRMR
jgi:16S rRNA (cytosine967-C5)-methyltransferase